MFTPKAFRQTDFAQIRTLMIQHPLATLICTDGEHIESCHAPLYWQDDGTEFGVLYGHIAQKNPLAQMSPANQQWLVIFQDTGHYISPNWYPSKQITHKEVPTWNYRSVHFNVNPTLITESGKLKYIIKTLSDIHEASQPKPWSIDDAPEAYIDAMCRAIIGFKLEITDYQAQFKLSQNKSDANKVSVIESLAGLDTDTSKRMAQHVKQHVINH